MTPDRWDAEANEICGAIGFNVGRTMISCALRMAYREGAREVESLKNDRDSAVRSLSEAIRDRNKMADAADKAEAERDAALRAVNGVWYFINYEAFEDWKVDFAKIIDAAEARYGANN